MLARVRQIAAQALWACGGLCVALGLAACAASALLWTDGLGGD